jgi:hypothetical protein
MQFKIMNKFLRFISPKNVIAISLSPIGIFFKSETYMKYLHIMNHEKIHWCQQKETLVIFYYIIYIIEFFIKLLILGKSNAIISISFEQEAYFHENEPSYILNRKPYSWIKYIFKSY